MFHDPTRLVGAALRLVVVLVAIGSAGAEAGRWALNPFPCHVLPGWRPLSGVARR